MTYDLFSSAAIAAVFKARYIAFIKLRPWSAVNLSIRLIWRRPTRWMRATNIPTVALVLLVIILKVARSPIDG
jgi:hypothetical protein